MNVKVNAANENIERILQSAVVATWADLMGSGQSGLIHIEYAFAANGTLDCLHITTPSENESKAGKGLGQRRPQPRKSAAPCAPAGKREQTANIRERIRNNLAFVDETPPVQREQTGIKNGIQSPCYGTAQAN